MSFVTEDKFYDAQTTTRKNGSDINSAVEHWTLKHLTVCIKSARRYIVCTNACTVHCLSILIEAEKRRRILRIYFDVYHITFVGEIISRCVCTDLEIFSMKRTAFLLSTSDVIILKSMIN